MGKGGWLAVVVTAALVAIAAAQSSTGQFPTCASKLSGCADYINATRTPPSTCCNPLKEAVTQERKCLCDLYANPALLNAFKINITQAMNLPKLCNIDTGSKDPNICKGTAPSPSSTRSTTSPSGSGSGSGSGGKNAADKITGTGLVASLLMLGTYLFFY